jgi:hypothetical protein
MEARMNRPAALVALTALVATLAACAEGPKVVQPLPPGNASLHPDLPSPQGFVFVENQSHSSPTGSFRVVNQTLEGKERRVEGAVKFYKEAFPAHGWTLEKEEGQAPGTIRLSFVKKEERCRIEISEPTRAVVTVRLKVNRKD